MVGSGPNREESVGSQREDHFVNLERRRGREASIHTYHIGRSHSRTGSHVSHDEETRNLKLEIDHLCRKLRRKQREASHPSFKVDSDEDGYYRLRSGTPPSESFSLSPHLEREERYQRKRAKSSRPRSIGNDMMSKVLCQISKSLFSCRIDRAKLPCRFMQPTFTIYNGRTDLVEHVSHFNQRMAVHSKNEALMCKVFPSSLRPVAMRWFDGLVEGSISSFKS